MPFHVYLLKCVDGSYYAGHTDALEARLAQHQAGMGSDWTKRRLPVELMWTEAAPTRDEALAFERRIKRWTRGKKEALIAGNWALVSHLARSPRERPSTSLRTTGLGEGTTGKANANGCPGDIRETELRTNGVETNGDSSGKEGE